jgi:hypothetical protein
MNTSYTPAQIGQFRRDAKRLARLDAIFHSEALDRIAAVNGFKNWSLLAKNAVPANPVSHPAVTPVAKPVPVDTPKRYYLHGDKEEGNPTLYYCARCDVFVEAEHFETHDSKGNNERYLTSLARWTQREQEVPFNWSRSRDATNILAAPAVAANSAYEASRSPFHRWIEGKRGRNSPLGDLAKDIWGDREFPVAAKTRAEVEQYLGMRGAAPEAIKALKQAWTQFSVLAR